ncbi:MAG: tetratricopeptide repeat protein [Candidatus Thorarchaeota archaeon]
MADAAQYRLTMPLFRRQTKEYKLAASLLLEGNAKEAIPLLRDILKKDPNHSNAMVTLAVALLEIQENPVITSPETEEAFHLLNRAAQIAPKDPVPLFNRGVCYRKLGMREEALDSFHAALEIRKRLPLALLHIAEINYELENWDTAIEYARLAVIRDPALSRTMPWVRDALEKAGKLEKKGTDIQKPKSRARDW